MASVFKNKNSYTNHMVGKCPKASLGHIAAESRMTGIGTGYFALVSSGLRAVACATRKRGRLICARKVSRSFTHLAARYHDLFADAGREKVAAETISWIADRLA